MTLLISQIIIWVHVLFVTVTSLPLMLTGTPPKVGGINITLSWTNTIPSLTVSWEAVTYSSAVMYNVYYTDMLQDQPVSTNTASADGLSTAFFESILACTTYYVWVSAISINTQLEGPFGDRATTDSSEGEIVCKCVKHGFQHSQKHHVIKFVYYSSRPGRYSNSYQDCQ